MTETFGKMTCLFFEYQLTVYFCYPKKSRKFSIIFGIFTVKNQTKIKQWYLQSLTYLWLARFAHSRGFCMGSRGNLG